jgi:hypothetical protein
LVGKVNIDASTFTRSVKTTLCGIEIAPSADFETFERETCSFELLSDVTHVCAKRGFHGGALVLESELFAPRALCVGDQFADRSGHVGRGTQVHGALPATVAIAERVVGAKSTVADRAPGGDDGGLSAEEVGSIFDKVLNAS